MTVKCVEGGINVWIPKHIARVIKEGDDVHNSRTAQPPPYSIHYML